MEDLGVRSRTDNERDIGILGGMAPITGVLLHQHIIEATPVGRDQDHHVVHHVSYAPYLSDRTRFVQGKIQQNPAEGAMKALRIFNAITGETNRGIVVGIPCNSFHVKPIFGRLMDLLAESNISRLEVLHMIRETIEEIMSNREGIKRIGLLSTTGTRQELIYHDFLREYGFEVIEVAPEDQDGVHEAIYHPQWGIKCAFPVTEMARGRLVKSATELIRKKAEVVILGCAAIPLALTETKIEDVRLIDPTRILAKRLVDKAKG